MNDSIKLSQGDYKVAIRLYKEFFDDEAFARSICFHLEQAIEKLLKGWLELEGIACWERHDIRKILKLFTDNGLPVLEEFDYMASILTEWATVGQYDLDFVIAEKYVQAAISIYNKLLEQVVNKFHIEPNQKSATQEE